MLTANVLTILYITLFRTISISQVVIEIAHFKLFQYPLKTHSLYIFSELLNNLVLFISPGYLMRAFFTMFSRRYLSSFVFIKLLQHYFSFGICKIDDIINNAAGALIGALILTTNQFIRKGRIKL